MPITTIQVNPDDLVPNPWNSNVVSPDNETKLENSLKKFGMFKPVIVRELPNGTLQIIGGENRAKVAKRVGLTVIPAVNLGEITDKKAKEISLIDNSRFGQDDTLKLTELIGEIGPIEDISLFLPYSESDLNSIFSSSSIALEELEALDLPTEEVELPKTKLAQTHQIMRFKVSIKDVDTIAKIIEKTIKTQGFDESDSLMNAGDALVHLLTKE